MKHWLCKYLNCCDGSLTKQEEQELYKALQALNETLGEILKKRG